LTSNRNNSGYSKYLSI